MATEELIDRIDRTLMRMRRLAIKPVPNDVNLVEGEQHLSHGKMLACTLLAARLARGEDDSPLAAFAPETLPEEALELEAPAEAAESYIALIESLQ